MSPQSIMPGVIVSAPAKSYRNRRLIRALVIIRSMKRQCGLVSFKSTQNNAPSYQAHGLPRTRHSSWVQKWPQKLSQIMGKHAHSPPSCCMVIVMCPPPPIHKCMCWLLFRKLSYVLFLFKIFYHSVRLATSSIDTTYPQPCSQGQKKNL